MQRKSTKDSNKQNSRTRPKPTSGDLTRRVNEWMRGRNGADALANAGACAEAGGRGDRAESYLRAALRLDPENSVALSAMAEYQYRSVRYLEARAFSQRRLAAAPPSADVLLLASQIEEKMGDMAAAERYRQRLGREFPQALQQNPGG